MSPVWIRLHTGEITAQQHVMVMFGPRDGSVCISSKTLRGLFFSKEETGVSYTWNISVVSHREELVFSFSQRGDSFSYA